MGNTFSAHALQFSIVDIGTLSGSASSIASAINDNGQVTGGSAGHAFIWQNGQMTDITPTGATGTVGDAINNSGVIVGPSGSGPDAFIWSSATDFQFIESLQPTPPPPNPVLTQSHANGNNDLGQVVGNAGFTGASAGIQAFVWQPGQAITNIGGLGFARSNAYDINNAGQVVGTASLNQSVSHAFIWQNNQMTDLDPLGANNSNNSTAFAINNAGQAVGYANDSSGVSHATLWQNGQALDLGTLNGGDSQANAINDGRQVVGSAGERAFLWWQGGSMVDLNTLRAADVGSQAFTLNTATGINSAGHFVGQGTINGQNHGFIATPTGTLNWIATSGTANWDTPANWELGYLPSPALGVAIAPSVGNSVVVNGPNGSTAETVDTLSLGGGGGTATLNLNSQPLFVTNGVSLLAGGSLALGGGEKLGNTSSVAVNGGTFDLGANNNTVAAVQLQSGSITGTTGTLTSTSDYDMQSGTVSANLSGAVDLTKTTPGIVTLSGANSYIGLTSVQAGTLTLAGGSAIADAGQVFVSPGATLNLGTSETIGSLGNGGTIDGVGRTLTAAFGYNLTGGTVNANLGTGTMTVATGTTILNGSSAAGLVNINSGALVLGSAERLANTAVLNLNGGIFDLVGYDQTVSQVNLNGGTIQNGMNLLTGSLNSTSGYVLQSGTIDTNLGGSGGVDVNGASTDSVILLGTNTYTGPTTINGGTLAVANLGSIANSSGLNIGSNGIFDITDTAAGASIQSLSGGGAVNIAGSPLTLTNASGTYAGVINGVDGALIIAGGKQTLTGINTYTGPTTINPGASLGLTGSGSIAQSQVITNDGTFNVTDTSVQFNGDFVNNGAYISDPSTSTFTNLTVGENGYLVGGAGDTFIVTGNFENASVQNALWNTSAASLVFSSPESSPGSVPNPTPQHVMDLPGVDKGSTAAGAVNNFAWGSVTLSSGNTLTLKDGNGTPGAALYASRLILPGGIGDLSNISSSYNVYFDPTQPENQYLAQGGQFGSGGGLLLPWSFVPFDLPTLEPGLTTNQQNFAEAVDEACTSPRGILVQRCSQLQSLSIPQQKAAIASLTPDQVPGQVAGPVLFKATSMGAPFSRLASLRNSGGTGLFSFNFNGVQIQQKKLANILGMNAKGGSAGADGEPFRDSPLGMYVQARFSFGDMQTTSEQRGFNSQTRAVTLGADYRFSDQLVAGLAFNYTNASTDYVNSSGHMNSDSYMGFLYGSYYLPKDFYVDWLASYGGNDYSFDRRFGYVGFASQTSANPSGDQFGFALNSGKDFNWEGWLLNPYVRFEYLNVHIGSYRENGGGGFDMTTGGQTNHSFTTDLGAQISHAFSLSWGVLTPALRVEWEHQYLNDNRAIGMRLAQASPGLGNFVIQTGNPDRDYFNLGGSVSATLPNGGAGFVRYQTRLGQTAISDHIVEAGVRLTF